MNINREVILDLLPSYFSGEASASTIALVTEYSKQDEEIGRRIQERDTWQGAASLLPPDLELRAFTRTRHFVSWGRWLFGAGLCFSGLTLLGFFTEWSFQGWRSCFAGYPVPFKAAPALGFASWICYFYCWYRLRLSGLGKAGKAEC